MKYLRNSLKGQKYLFIYLTVVYGSWALIAGIIGAVASHSWVSIPIAIGLVEGLFLAYIATGLIIHTIGEALEEGEFELLRQKYRF